jgi:hypothetical protein
LRPLVDLHESVLYEQNGHRKKEQSDPAENPTAKTAHAISKKVLGKPLTLGAKRESWRDRPLRFWDADGRPVRSHVRAFLEDQNGGRRPLWRRRFPGADELALPALKLAKGAAEYPISTHLYGLTSHIIWATTTDAVRRLVRKIL